MAYNVSSEVSSWTSRDTAVGVYSTLCFLFGFCGNMFVLITSHLYHAISLDAVTIIFVRNLALADVLLVLNTVLPTLISIFAKGWVLGELLCDITAHFNFIPVMVNIYLVLYMSLFKLIACKAPFRIREITPCHAWLLVLLAYVLAGTEFLESIFLAKKGIWMGPVDRCLSMIYITHPTLMLWNAIIPVGLPILAIIFSNCWIFCVARRVIRLGANGWNSSQTRALTTVCAVSGLFVLSWTPKLIYVAVVNITHQQIPWAVAFSHYFPFINSVGNPIIYTITNRTYGLFVKNLFTKFKLQKVEASLNSRSVVDSDVHTAMAKIKDKSPISPAPRHQTAPSVTKETTGAADDDYKEGESGHELPQAGPRNSGIQPGDSPGLITHPPSSGDNHITENKD